jgi:hypothetical protein
VATAYAWALVGVVGIAQILVVPTHFRDYDTMVAAPFAVGLAHGGAWCVGVLSRRISAVGACATALGLIVFIQPFGSPPVTPDKFGGHGYAPRTAVIRQELDRYPGCVYSPQPKFLIIADRFSQAIEEGCPITLDLAGIRIAYRAGNTPPEGRRFHADNVLDLMESLVETTGVAFVEATNDFGLDQDLKKREKRGKVVRVTKAGRLTVWEVPTKNG